MQKQFLRLGCLLIGLFTVIPLVIGGWWILGSSGQVVDAPPPSPVQVFILSPASGDEVSSGDYLPVTMQVVAPEEIVSAELFVDGQSLGAGNDSPENAWWTWQAGPAGIHTLSARVTTADGQVGQSQAVIVTVLSGSVKQVRAEEGQTLEQIGAGFGVPPDQMASANPNVDPSQPLAVGQSVQVPGGAGGGEIVPVSGDGQPQPDGNPAGESINLIHWQFQTTEAVDKSYCYISFGDDVWEKIPKKPFNFFNGPQVNYPQSGFMLNMQKHLIEAQCWGWLGGDLKFLGEGETQFDMQQPPHEVVLAGTGFQLVGLPEMKPMGGGGIMPPPYALREPSGKDECLQNHGLGALFLCELLAPPDGQVKDKYILVWEWQAPPCWPGQTCVTKVDGYRVYEIDPLTQTEKFLKQLDHQGQKVAAVPIGWGTCFGVRAYLNTPGLPIESGMATWCPGQELQPKKITYQPSNVLTVGDQWVWYDDDCSGVAELWHVPFEDEGMVGIIEVDTDDCGAMYDGTAGVKFPAIELPQGAVLQKAELRFTMNYLSYKVYFGDDKWLASNVNWMCPTNLGTAKVDWTAWGGGSHFTFAPPHLDDSMEPYMTLPDFAGEAIEITPLIRQWIKAPQTNQGLVLYPDAGRFYDYHFVTNAEIQECFSFLTDWQLDVFYLEP